MKENGPNMSIPSKNTSRLRSLLIYSLIFSFIFLSFIFVYQYSQYGLVEKRLNAAYSVGQTPSDGLYKLFSTYSEADNLFRLYTIDFTKENYGAYKDKIDTIKYYVDSLSSLPIAENLFNNSATVIATKDNLAMEYANLKKDVDHLILFAKDSLSILSDPINNYKPQKSTISTDQVISKILKDTSHLMTFQDTVINKKKSLFSRIFNSKNDTLLSNRSNQNFNINQIDLIQRNIENLVTQQERTSNSNIKNLQRAFLKLQETERILIFSNYHLLNNLKTGIDRLEQHEIELRRKAEELDFIQYKNNTQQFGLQLAGALAIMLLMILFIIYYQYNAATYERKIRNEKEYANKIAEEKTSVLATISHEIRTPINALLGVVDIIKKSKGLNNDDQKLILSANYELMLINSTVNDILGLSKLETGSLHVINEYFAPHQLLSDVIKLHTYQAEAKGLLFTYHIDFDPKIQIYSNALRIKQIASNLVGNAIKYTKKGSVSFSARIERYKDKQNILIEVKDTGIGISDENKAHIFRKYYITETKNKIGGFGLGLYISKLLCEQLNGNISFNSKFGVGSTFTLSVPIQKQLLSEEISEPPTIADLPDDLRIVIIDDSRINLLFIQQFLGQKKHVYTFDEGQDALDFLKDNDVDIILTDMQMPEINGWDILNNIREIEQNQHIKVFALTSEKMLLEGQNVSKFKHTFDGILSKPIDEQELVITILKNL
ncbi:ATP-binding protein [Sphingobacterium olei]|nr:ATP-binding protein [Sphingobacterium olei]